MSFFGTRRHPWCLYFSSATHGNPSYAAVGWVLKDSRNKDVVVKGSFVNEKYTSTQAFYVGLIRGLQDALERKIAHILVYGNSGAVCNQINQLWTVGSKKLLKFYDKAMDLVRCFESFEIEYSNPEENKVAVKAANDARDEYIKCLNLFDSSSDCSDSDSD